MHGCSVSLNECLCGKWHTIGCYYCFFLPCIKYWKPAENTENNTLGGVHRSAYHYNAMYEVRRQSLQWNLLWVAPPHPPLFLPSTRRPPALYWHLVRTAVPLMISDHMLHIATRSGHNPLLQWSEATCFELTLGQDMPLPQWSATTCFI